MKKYVEKNGQTFKVEVYYKLGGENYATGKMQQRGYYFSVRPVKIEDHGSYTTERYIGWSGVEKCILPVSRKSAKAEKQAEDTITEERINARIDYVIEMNAARNAR